MKHRFRSRSTHQDQYPLATIAAYGPDNQRATKLVVSVLERPEQDPSEMRTWTTQQVDVRHDLVIAADVAAFLQERHVQQSVAGDRIIGCPHEEGIDYPMGRACPRCPFWAGIDRFTHEPITTPTPTLSVPEILVELAADGPEPPYEALASADGHREALVAPLLRAIEVGVSNPSGASAEEAALFSYALYLFAKWRDARAYPHVVRWLRMPGEAPFDIGGDMVTQDGARILASVCDGHLQPIVELATDRHANEYGRGAGVQALTLLAAWLEVPREQIITRLLWLGREGLEREPGQVWDSWAAACADIEAFEVFPDIRRAYVEGLTDPRFMHPSELDTVEASPPGQLLASTRERWHPIDDVVEATAWWARRRRDAEGSDLGTERPYRAPPKVGRNELCPCGSGKKFKKCCGQ